MVSIAMLCMRTATGEDKTQARLKRRGVTRSVIFDATKRLCRTAFARVEPQWASRQPCEQFQMPVRITTQSSGFQKCDADESVRGEIMR